MIKEIKGRASRVNTALVEAAIAAGSSPTKLSSVFSELALKHKVPKTQIVDTMCHIQGYIPTFDGKRESNVDCRETLCDIVPVSTNDGRLTKDQVIREVSSFYGDIPRLFYGPGFNRVIVFNDKKYAIIPSFVAFFDKSYIGIYVGLDQGERLPLWRYKGDDVDGVLGTRRTSKENLGGGIFPPFSGDYHLIARAYMCQPFVCSNHFFYAVEFDSELRLRSWVKRGWAETVKGRCPKDIVKQKAGDADNLDVWYETVK